MVRKPNPHKVFCPDLWSEEIVKSYQSHMVPPFRDKYTQMLRDAALGHPEFPSLEDPRQEISDALAYQLANDFDAGVFQQLRDKLKQRQGMSGKLRK